MNAFLAGKGEAWVCGVCRRTGKDRKTMAGDCCFMHAILVEEGSIEKDKTGLVIDCQAVSRQTFRAAKATP